jgi:hypothetical protein
MNEINRLETPIGFWCAALSITGSISNFCSTVPGIHLQFPYNINLLQANQRNATKKLTNCGVLRKRKMS